MGELIFGIFLFITVIFIAAVLFFGWMVIGMIRMSLRWISGDVTTNQVRARPTAQLYCPNEGCHAANPAGARFCRRCGRGMVRQHVGVRKVAIF